MVVSKHGTHYGKQASRIIVWQLQSRAHPGMCRTGLGTLPTATEPGSKNISLILGKFALKTQFGVGFSIFDDYCCVNNDWLEVNTLSIWSFTFIIKKYCCFSFIDIWRKTKTDLFTAQGQQLHNYTIKRHFLFLFHILRKKCIRWQLKSNIKIRR